SVWKLTYEPPTRTRWEILEGDGPMATGSYLDNVYSDVSGGILIKSQGDIRVTRFPGFLQSRVVRSALNHINDQDIEYLRTHSR
ncbi:MAG: hypothetical protein L3J96_01985, partial [Thermoplasmata archaeon]|nr:hypothetical protein [Thermoplasmata archaeon]